SAGSNGTTGAGTGAEGEVDTNDKVLYAALNSGKFDIHDLSSRTTVYTSSFPSHSPLTSIAFSSSLNTLITSNQAGVLAIYDTRNLETPLQQISRAGLDDSSPSISDISFIGENRKTIGVCTGDGTPFVLNWGVGDGEGLGVVTEELVGWDCDPIVGLANRARLDGEVAWVASADVVRTYSV
ncbi:hypothetical protein SISSUDRAFT_1123709, partial [Sistotremastrum suecicum HHB10207 ss-3]